MGFTSNRTHVLHIAFENVRDPIALVLRFDNKLQTFPIHQETLGPAVVGISNGANAATLAQQGYTNLGGLDLTGWCQATYGADFKAWARGTGAGDWSCQGTGNDRREISVADACKQQYRPDAKAEALGGVTSWQCWAREPAPAQKGVNLDAWCKKQFGSPYKAVVRGSTAGDWGCEDRRQVSVKDACILEYGNSVTGAKALNNNDPASWVCTF